MGKKEETDSKKALDIVLRHQADVAEAEERVAYLQGVVEQQQGIIADAKSYVTNVPELMAKRENLLADFVLGHGNQDAIDTLDKEIAAAREELSKHTTRATSVTADAKQTIAGLKRKLEATREDLSELQSQTPSVIDSFLMIEAERLGAEYVDAALVTAEKHRQLLAMDALIVKHNNHERSKSIRGLYNMELHLPLFRLNCHRRHDNPNRREDQLYRAKETQLYDEVRTAAVDQERERITNLGVNL